MRRILLAANEPTTRLTLTSALEARDYRVASVADGAAAVDSAARRPLDAVLLDLALPDVGGIELTRTLREATSRPIIAMSAASDTAEKVAVLDAGADDLSSPSNATATAPAATASGSASPSPAVSPKPWAAPSPRKTPPAAA